MSDILEIKIKVFLLQDVSLADMQVRISEFVDKTFQKSDEWMDFHNENTYKNYVFGGFYPIESDHVYKKDSLYTITIRATDVTIAKHFEEQLPHVYTAFVKGLLCEVRILPRKVLEEIYSLTPVILKLKNNEGYWRGKINITEFERLLKENLIKKYNARYETKITGNFPIWTYLEVRNKYPISVNYKKIKLLGDKVCLKIASDKMSQELAYFALGSGLLTMNGRGFGFVNYRWL